ncbi:MAG: DUF2341 domain-containing protein [Candidatus Staskawiczbacteria bacterium]|nr:DUF2341 domain-containing protein [Candidatus Staskawiczbacteria bacterium]
MKKRSIRVKTKIKIEPAKIIPDRSNFFIFNILKRKIKKKSEREIKIFSNKRMSVSFRPVLFLQGAVVLILTIFVLFITTSLILPGTQVAYTRIIKKSVVKQTSAAIVGEPVSWTVIVKRQNIKLNQDLVKLPKTANKIKVAIITEKEANDILNKAVPNPKNEFTTKNRKQLIGMFNLDLSGINFKSTSTAGFLELKEIIARILETINDFFLADLVEAVENVVDKITEQGNKDIIKTDDAKYVDLSKYELKEEKDETKEEVKQEKPKEKQEDLSDEKIKEEKDGFLPRGKKPSKSEKGDEKQKESGGMSDVPQTDTSVIPESDVIPASLAESRRAEVGIQSESTNAGDDVDSPIQGNDSVEQATESIQKEPVEESGISETPQLSEEYVEVTYETEGPTITEQDTDKGKLVTVSDTNTNTVDCEALKPANDNSQFPISPSSQTTPSDQPVVKPSSLVASLLTSATSFLKNIFSSLNRFLFADLEEAATDAIQTVVEQVIPPVVEPVVAPEAEVAEPTAEPIAEETLAEPAQSESIEVGEEPETVVPETSVEETVGGPTSPETPAEESEPESELVEQLVSEEDSVIPEPDVIPASLAESRRAEAGIQSESTNTDDTAYQDCLNSQVQLTDVLAYTTIPEIYKVGQEHLIKIKWTNENGQDMPFTAHDLNNNGKIDYLEWTVPHLSEQTFEIIFISKAWHLDQNKEILEDIYDQVSINEATWQENTYSTIPQGEYVRVTFEQVLDNTKDITIYAKPSVEGEEGTIDVYTKDGTDLIATFPIINHEDTYKIILTDLQNPTDQFDLKIIGNLDIDYIVDPTKSKKATFEFRIPASKNTPAKRLEYILVAQEKLRRLNNEKSAQLSEQEMKEWIKGSFKPYSLLISKALLEARTEVEAITDASSVSVKDGKVVLLDVSKAEKTALLWKKTRELSDDVSEEQNVILEEFSNHKFNPSQAELDEVVLPELNEMGEVFDPYEDFTTYTIYYQGDIALTVTSSKVSWSGSVRQYKGWVYADKGADHFGTTLTHTVDAQSTSWTSGNLDAVFWAITNVAAQDAAYWNTNHSQAVGVQLSSGSASAAFRLVSWETSTAYDQSIAFNHAQTYYFSLDRDDQTLQALIYSDSARTVLEDTVAVSIPTAGRTYRYIYAFATNDTDQIGNKAGFSENLDLQGGGGPRPFDILPASGSTITDTTQTITFTTDKNATCYLSLDGDEAYADMSDDTLCTGGGTTSQSCTTPDLGVVGEKSVYTACTDGTNADTADTNEDLTYTLESLAGFSYRKQISITGESGAGTNYQVKLMVGESSGSSGDDFDLAGHALSSFDDLRFTSSDTQVMLDYWIQSISGTTPNQTATVWVKVSDNLDSAVNIYAYYGDSGASAYSNGDDTFIFFDDFNGASVDTSKWTVGGSMTQSGGYATGSTSLTDYLFGKTIIPINTSTTIRMQNKSLNGIARPGVLQSHGNPASVPGFGWQDYSNHYRYTDTYNTAVTQQQHTVFTTDWYILESTWQASSSKFYVDGSIYATHTTQIPISSKFLYDQVEGNANYDYIFNRKYVSTEPAFSSSAAEESVGDTTPPAPSSISPASASTISDTTQTITFTTDENATCYLSLDGDEAYADMSDDTLCTGGGTTSQSCTTPDLGADGAKSVYIACTDGTNADTTATNEDLTYTLDASTPDIVAVDAGASSGDRTSLTSDTWFKYSDTGSDD